MTNTLPENFDTLVREAMDEWQVPGLALAITRDGEGDWVKAYGLRILRHRQARLYVAPLVDQHRQAERRKGLGDRAEDELRLYLADGKVDGAALVSSARLKALHEPRAHRDSDGSRDQVRNGSRRFRRTRTFRRRRLDWTKPVRDYLPEFRLHDAVATERVTVIDLLCHHTGLPRHDWIWMPADISRAEMLVALRYLEPSKDIRAAYQYCNLGYVAAGMVAERISGQTWEDFTLERIMKPLGMVHTGFSDADLTRAPDSARPYVLHDHEKPGEFTRRRARLWPIADTPAGGINVAASDMARYMRVVSHSGGWIGWGTLMSLMPERRCGVTVLTNRTVCPVTEILTNAIFDHLIGRDAIPWFDRFREQRRAYMAQRPADVAAKRAARRTDASSRPMSEYVGDYDHPAYGRVTIEAANDALAFRYRGMSGALIHRHYDAFELDEQPETLWPGGLGVTFVYDREGQIDRLLAPLEPSVADTVFRRGASGEALDAAFRQACVGVYRGGATVHLVAIDADGELTLAPTGQPTYRLAPYRERVFAIRELDGFRVEFVRDESGAVTKIIFHQPDGIFQAQREAK